MLIIGDMHTSIKAGNQAQQEIFHTYFKNFLKDIFAYVDKNKVKTLVLLGDVFDVRKHLNLWAADWFIKNFRDECVFRGLHVIVIIGNHDIFYRESIAVNSPLMMLQDHPDTFTLVMEPTELNVDGMDCLFVPWICNENRREVMGAIRNTSADYLFGHFEFDGFEMQKGQLAKAELKHTDFNRFKKIISGHYHHRSFQDNVIYTGTPWELTWQDCDDEKGVYELKDGQFEWIKNPYTMFGKIVYNEMNKPAAEKITGKYIKLQVLERVDKKKFNSFMDFVYGCGPIDVIIEEDLREEFTSQIVLDQMKSTIQFLHDYIDKSDLELDKDEMKATMNELYNEAMAEEA